MRTVLTVAGAFCAGIITAVVGRWVRSRWTIVRRDLTTATGEAAAKK